MFDVCSLLSLPTRPPRIVLHRHLQGNAHHVVGRAYDGVFEQVVADEGLHFGEAPPHLAAGKPGGIESKQLTLTPGTYELYCSLTGGTPPGTPGDTHAAAGMNATITVVAP